MAVVSDTIPEALQAEVEAALAWFNAGQPDPFEVTGIVDPELSIQSDQPRELRLVLCGGDICQKKEFLVSQGDAGFEVSFAEDEAQPGGDHATVQSELDPPPGARRHWLDSVLKKHRFTLLLFYRGFW